MHRRNASHVAHKYKESHESEQKTIIDLRQRTPVKKEQRKGNEGSNGNSVNKTHYRHNAQNKQNQV